MEAKYIESEKVWRAPDLAINCIGLGQAILDKLEKSEQQKVLEVNYDNGMQLTVGDVRRQTITVAQNLTRLGIKKGDVIVLFSLVNVAVTPITFACFTLGAPINFFDTKFEEVQIRHTLELLDPTAIIYEEEYKSQLFKALERLNLPRLKHILSIDYDNDAIFKSVVDLESFQATKIEDPVFAPAMLMPTSGSTGFPKVIIQSHAMMMQGIHRWWQLQPSSIIFCFSPLRWISQVIMMLQAVFFGVRRVYTAKSPSGSLGRDIIETCKITHLFTVPGIYLSILKAAEKSNLTSLKTALIGGEVINDILVEFSAKVATDCRVVKCYGMTELAACIATDEHINKPNVNGGNLTKGLTAKIIDGDGNALGPNEMGRVCLKSTIPFLGYLKNEEANNEIFLEGGWLNTGDYGCIDSNNLLNIATRDKFLLRAGSTILIPNDVESIVNSHPKVLTSVLVGIPNPKKPADEVGTVFVVKQGNQPDMDIEVELKEFIEQKLTGEQLQVVKYIKVISEMPLVTSSAKVDRIALKEMIKEC